MPVFAQHHLQRVGDRLSRLAIPGESILYDRWGSTPPRAVPHRSQIGHRISEIAGVHFAFGSVQKDFGIAQHDLILATKYSGSAVGPRQGRVTPFLGVIIAGARRTIEAIPGVGGCTDAIDGVAMAIGVGIWSGMIVGLNDRVALNPTPLGDDARAYEG